MSQKSLLELLSVTNNAVKALDKSSSSKSSLTGRVIARGAENQPPSESRHGDHSVSGDSGRCVEKTVTNSHHQHQATNIKDKYDVGNDSDLSTTASDVLIRSTLVDDSPTQRSADVKSSSSVRESRHELNDIKFSVADAMPVKVFKHHLREIVSPQESIDSKMKKASSKPGITSSATVHNKNSNNVCGTKTSSAAENGNRKTWVFEKTRQMAQTEAGKKFPGQRHDTNHGLYGSATLPSYKVERHERGKTEALRNGINHFNPEASTRDVKQFSTERKTSENYIDNFPLGVEESATDGVNGGISTPSAEKLTYKVSRHGGPTKTENFLEQEKPDYTEDEQSGTSSQPEIVTVEERLVNISSQALLLSDYEDAASEGSTVDKGREAMNKPQSFPRAMPMLGSSLKQGALNSGPSVKAGKGDEVEICKFSLTDKQQEIKNALVKRANQSKPVKRVIQPKMVHSIVNGDDLNKNNNMDSELAGVGNVHVGNIDSITAAVAASAAVAATQPFLKMQQKLENKMQALLGEMERVQKQAGPGTSESGKETGRSGTSSNPRLEHLEQQVHELTERRLQHLETLQSQQMELQAHLLSMSRDMSRSHHRSQHEPSTSRQHPTYFPTTVTHPTASRSYSRALIERELMKGRLQGEDAGRWGNTSVTGKEGEGSVLDTPNPRSQPPRPANFGGEKGGLLKEILNAEPSPQLNSTFNLSRGQTATARHGKARPREAGGSPVDKARKLVLDLSNLEEQTARSIATDLGAGKRRRLAEEEPAPLEQYLKHVRDPNTTPYPKLGQRRSRSNSPAKSASGTSHASSPTKSGHVSYAAVKDKYGDARNVWQSVISEKETLEKNLALMMHARQDVDVYSLIQAISGDDRSDLSRIQKMVDQRIASLQDEVKREVEWDLQHNIPTTSSSLQDASKKPTSQYKPAVGFGSGAPRMSETNTGLRHSRSDTTAVPSAAGKGKKVIKAKPAPAKSKIPYQDEAAMTQIYGKAQYQKGRTTVKDPYLHFQNQTKHRAFRIPSPQRPENVLKVRSATMQTAGGLGQTYSVPQPQVPPMDGAAPRQYYFSPALGYVPITSSSAPVAGQLVPMAIPLGKPRMEPGVATGRNAVPTTSVATSSPVRPLVTASSNVVMVAVSGEGETQAERMLELNKQVLPSIDIDTLSPPSTPRGSDIHVTDPDPSHNLGYLHTVYYQDSEDGSEAERDRTVTEHGSDDDDQHGTGIALPGYHQPTPAREPFSGPSLVTSSGPARPSQSAAQLREEGRVAWEERSDELADDLRTRDVLQNKAKSWVEQELMARLLMRLYPVMSAQPDPDLLEKEETESIPDDESLLVGDLIGQRGLQLFIDAGQPVNNTLVNALVREVIAEKVGSMLGRRQDIDSTDAANKAALSKKRGAVTETDVDDEETQFVRPSRGVQRVVTPQPTPRTSPIPGFITQHAPVTPPLTPPPPPLPQRQRSPVKDLSAESSAGVSAATSMTPPLEPTQQPAVTGEESETEMSTSLDLSEELRMLEAKARPARTLSADDISQHQYDLVTPTNTPPSSPLPHTAQPPATTTPAPSPPVAAPQEDFLRLKDRQAMMTSTKVPLDPDFVEPGHPVLSQPAPPMMSVAVNTEPKAEERQSPHPQRRARASIDQSVADSVSSLSSVTDTINENVSEGQWLISRSEGQVAAFPGLDEEMYRQAAYAASRRKGAGDVSGESTLRETDDINLDDTDLSRSEGEFMHLGEIVNPETDPVLALLIQTRHPQLQGGQVFGQYDLPPDRVQQVLSSSDLSSGEFRRNGAKRAYDVAHPGLGEISEGQLLPSNVEELVKPSNTHGGGVTVVTPKMASPDTQAARGPRSQGHERARSASPPRHLASAGARSKTPPGRQQQYQPVSSGLPPGHTKRPLKSALVRSSDDSRLSFGSDHDSDQRGPPMESGTRSLTPDQFNTEAFLQSGMYVTRSMNSSGRQGSTKKSVDFDLSGTYYTSRRHSYKSDDGYSETSGTGGSDRLTSTGQSLGLKYSFEDTHSVSSVDRDSRTPHLRMSVTIPTIEGGSDSDVSEIDLSENNF